MASESIISATFGTPGAGKTYSRVKWLVDDFLINNPTGHYITNIPLNIEEISLFVSSRLSSGENIITPEDIKSRLHLIPDDVLIEWEKLNQLDNRDLNTFDSSTFPPSRYLQQFPLEGSHIAIDEFHKYFSKKGPKPLKKLWNDWFAEIRKTGCVFEAITQSYGQMSEEFLDKCATRLELVNHSDVRDPILGIRMGDYYELRAGLFNKLSLQRVSAIETMRGSSTTGRVVWRPTGKSDSFVLSPDYFRFYNSFRNYTGTSGQRKTPAEIYGRKIIFWFLRRNWFNILPRFLLLILFLWFTLGGGFNYALSGIFKAFSLTSSSNSEVKSFPPAPAAVSQPGPAAVSQPGPVAVSPPGSDLSSVNPATGKPYSFEEVQTMQRYKQIEFDAYRPALFWNKFCILRNSLEVNVGYKFIGGPLDGKTIKSVSLEKRHYILDDDTVVSMYGGVQSVPRDKAR